MTIQQSLTDWLYSSGLVEPCERITLDQLTADPVAYGIYATPGRTETEYIDGSRQITDYYSILVRRPAMDDKSRGDAAQWLEALEDWVADMNDTMAYPALDGGRTVTEVGISVNPYAITCIVNNTIYQLTLRLEYRKEN